jgi:hypothetical protein
VLAWVPAAFVELAQHGMSVSTVDNICWLEDAPLTKKPELLSLLASLR